MLLDFSGSWDKQKKLRTTAMFFSDWDETSKAYDHDDPNIALGNVCFISNFSGDCCNPALRINIVVV
jgi:hypothetical protein